MDAEVVGLGAERDPAAPDEPDVGTYTKRERKMTALCSGRAAERRRKMRSSNEYLGERRKAIDLAIGKPWAERVSRRIEP